MVRPEELIATDHISSKYIGESYYPLFSPDHKWWYLGQQRNNEALVFKNYDSRSQDGGGQLFSPDFQRMITDVEIAGCPHASFLQSTSKVPEARTSIEVRMLVFS